MKKIQWILFDQCNLRYIEPWVTDVVFLLYTPDAFETPTGSIRLAIRSRVIEYAIARAFLDELDQAGYTTHFHLCTSYRTGILQVLRELGVTECILMRPSEWWLEERISSWWLPIVYRPNMQFLISEDEYSRQYKKPPVMESFYRYMRRTRDILMDSDGTPLGAQWNYDHENRKYDRTHVPTWSWHPTHPLALDEAREFFGVRDLSVRTPLTRKDALSLLEYFIAHHARDFGRLEDAMYREDIFVHHSFLSTALNFWLLHADEVVSAIEAADIPLASKEGYIRQIIGWREYIHQFSLAYREDIHTENFFGFHEPLPESWWSYDGVSDTPEITTLACVDTVLSRVQHENYSHHIERLMIIGNYTLLMGYDPRSVNRWFMEMYTDAFDWVVTPNVMAMSQYSDGGRLATKPYVSSGNYIEKMSNYCQGCRYSVREKTCPMTALYWDFIDTHRALYTGGRQPYILSNLAKIDIEKVRVVKKAFLARQKSLLTLE